MTSPLGPAAPGPEVDKWHLFFHGDSNICLKMKSYAIIYDPIRCVVSYMFMVFIWDSGDMVVKWLCVSLICQPKMGLMIVMFFYWSFLKSTLE